MDGGKEEGRENNRRRIEKEENLRGYGTCAKKMKDKRTFY